MNAATADCLHSPQLLADAFSEFISASAQLEASYRDLQSEVAHLGLELSERNLALSRSLAENDRMRAALQQMLDSLPCGVVVVNNAASVVMINPEGRRLLDIDDAPVGTLQELARMSRIALDALAAGSNGESELSIESEAGRRWLAVSNRKLSGAAADAPGQIESIWILRDVTANKQAEQQREAARRATVLAEISTILAHEIRNPLASLELFAQLIEEDRDAAEQWISNLRAGIRTLSGTVNNVLSMNGEGNPRLKAVELAGCVRSGVEFVQPIAAQAGVELSFTAAANTPRIDGNEDGVRQIILNLVCNAIRHTPAGGAIRVSTRGAMGDGRQVALAEIADSGCGIRAEMMEHLFDAGFSGTGETPGLGLAVCKRIMAQHGGAISVTSRVNEGTTFELEFPGL
jgi:two-component system sensor histidine kinase FlrB